MVFFVFYYYKQYFLHIDLYQYIKNADQIF